MRRKYELYLNGMRADIAQDCLVLMNYKQTDASAPVAVYNSWSQDVILPTSRNNNIIFTHIEKGDSISRLNPTQRNPFVIYADSGTILESGYFKINKVSELQYSITLYGGLGGFLFGLMYNADGTKKTLADLNYDYDLGFTIDRDAVRSAWRRMAGLDSVSKWNVINFAPCYNGKPAGEFDAKKAFCHKDAFGITTSATEGNTRYGTKNSHVMIDMVNELDEWETGDLRSYLQRPVIRMRAVLDAIADPLNNGGYNVVLDSSFFKASNDYYNRTWLTLGRLDELTLPNEQGRTPKNLPATSVWASSAYGTNDKQYVEVTGLSHGATAKEHINVTFKPCIDAQAVLVDDPVLAREYAQTIDRRYERVVACYQLIAYDASGTMIGGSKVKMVTTKTRASDGNIMESIVSPANFVTKFNDAIATGYKTYQPLWVDENEDSMLEDAMYNGNYCVRRGAENAGCVVMDDDSILQLTFDIDVIGAASVKLHTEYLGIYTSNRNYYTQSTSNLIGVYGAPAQNITLYGLGNKKGSLVYDYSVSGTIRSGVYIPQDLLLSGTDSPADYLLSYCKMFGLQIVYDRASKQVTIMSRNAYYNGRDIDITDIVDKKSVSLVPYALNNHWYDFLLPVQGRFADYYKKAYGTDYGLARLNTGWEFDSAHNDVMNGNAYKGVVMSLHQSKYFERITEDGKFCPSAFIDGGSCTIWSTDNESKSFDIVTPSDRASIQYINTTHLGYDYSQYPKPEFCNAENNSIEGKNALLLFIQSYTTGYYSHYCITDDNGLMARYNEGKPCWLLGQHLNPANANYCITYSAGDNPNAVPFPIFRRWSDSANLDFGIAQEYDMPNASYDELTTIYAQAWKQYMMDKADTKSKVMTCKVRLSQLGMVGNNLLRNFYYYDNTWWVLNAIKNYILNEDSMVECEFIKVNDRNNYTNGQTY